MSAEMNLTSGNVEALICRVLAEDCASPILVNGILNNYAFDADKIEAERGTVEAMIAELPDEFLSQKGGGWSFLNLCVTKGGRQWTGLHLMQEHFLAVAMGLNLASIMMPREMWSIFPGGMPYVQFIGGDA